MWRQQEQDRTISLHFMYCYEPVLLLQAQLTERVIAELLSLLISSHSLMCNLQLAYQKFHFSETALLYVQKDILSALDAVYSTAFLLFGSLCCF